MRFTAFRRLHRISADFFLFLLSFFLLRFSTLSGTTSPTDSTLDVGPARFTNPAPPYRPCNLSSLPHVASTRCLSECPQLEHGMTYRPSRSVPGLACLPASLRLFDVYLVVLSTWRRPNNDETTPRFAWTDG